MAQPGLKRFAFGTALAVTACGGSPAEPGMTNAPTAPTSDGSARPTSTDASGWGKFHSKRFALTVPLPDGKAWKIDDHRSSELVAMHAPTSTRLVLVATQEEELMNRARCEERAKSRGWLKKAAQFTTLEDEVYVGPEAYDSRLWAALDPTATGGGVEGHVFLFGAFLRRCLLVHYSTSVASAKEEEVLASRLATASARIVKGITLDPLRTTDDATVPRDKPPMR